MRASIGVPANDIAIAMGENPEWAAQVLTLLTEQACRLIREAECAKMHTYDGKIDALKRPATQQEQE